MNPAQVKQMQLDSDFPTDKIIYLKTGSFSVPAMNTGNSTFAHGLSFAPLLGGNWSLTPDFAVTYEFGSGSYPAPVPGYFFATQTDIYANAANIYVNAQNITGSGITIYYRLFGFEPTTSAAVSSITSVSADSYIVNSGHNLTKLYMQGHVAGVSTTSTIIRTPLNHSLGYIPQVLAWRENIYDQILPMYYATPGTESLVTSLIVTTAQIIVLTPKYSSDDKRIHYRIYLDE